MVLAPTLTAYGPSVVFEAVPANRAPTGDKKISLPFKIQLTTNVPSDQTVQITFSSYKLYEDIPTNLYLNLV